MVELKRLSILAPLSIHQLKALLHWSRQSMVNRLTCTLIRACILCWLLFDTS